MATWKDSREMQYRTREARGFTKAESDLPDYSAVVSPSSPTQTITGKLFDILSYLGTKNPVRRPVTADDTLWLLDNTAYRNPNTGQWEAEFVSAVFAQHPSCAVVDAVNMVANKLELPSDDPNYPTIEERLLPFLQDIKPGTLVRALQDGRHSLRLGPSSRNGITNDVRRVHGHDSGRHHVPTVAEVPKGTDGMLKMKTFFAEAEGWGVISDIDDTIKVTMTGDPIGILRSTFLDTPQATPGMPEFYQYIQALIQHTSPFFYLSASPYNLYPFLRDFREQNYPSGTIILRDSSWMSISGLLTNLTVNTEEYKTDRMKKIHQWLPNRKFICIGDSTQTDPEAYGQMYRTFPGWIKVIFIRKVTDIAAIGIEDKNEPARFEKAFKDVPQERWHVFEDPNECKGILEDIVKSES